MNRSDRGRVDNTALEARPDVLTYTTAPLPADTEVIGEVSAEIWFSASLPSADVFVRLCHVDTGGRSWNVCDGLTRLASANEPAKAVVSLWPTAHRFKRGHRIRVQVSSGAFPALPATPAPRQAPCPGAASLRLGQAAAGLEAAFSRARKAPSSSIVLISATRNTTVVFVLAPVSTRLRRFRSCSTRRAPSSCRAPRRSPSSGQEPGPGAGLRPVALPGERGASVASQACGSRVPSTAAWATSLSRRFRFLA